MIDNARIFHIASRTIIVHSRANATNIFPDAGSKWWQSWIPPEPVTPLTTCTPNPAASATLSCQSAPHHHRKQKRPKGHFRRKSQGLLPLHSPLRSIPLGGGGRGRSKGRPRRWQVSDCRLVMEGMNLQPIMSWNSWSCNSLLPKVAIIISPPQIICSPLILENTGELPASWPYGLIGTCSMKVQMKRPKNSSKVAIFLIEILIKIN